MKSSLLSTSLLLSITLINASCSPTMRRNALNKAGTSNANQDPISGFVLDDPAPPHADIACTLRTAGGGCDHIFELNAASVTGPLSSMNRFNGITKGVKPGQTVCMKAGNYPYGRIWFENIQGQEGKPVIITNCGGKFVMGNDIDADGDGNIDESRGIDYFNSQFIKVTGTGSKANRYGIKMAGTSVGQAMNFTALSTDIEVEYVEIAKASFAGIMAKTDPNCNDTNPDSFRGGFIMRNVILHDNYIHGVGGEGFYIGYSFFSGKTQTCNGVSTLIFSHPIENVQIYRNYVENSGCEAIQVGCGRKTQIYKNYVRGFGISPFAKYQQNGIQLGGGSDGKIFNNYIENPDVTFSTGHGITIQSTGPALVHGNMILNASHGMYIHIAAAHGHDVVIANNTIVNPIGAVKDTEIVDGRGIWSFNQEARIHLINNLILLGSPKNNPAMEESSHVMINGIYDQMAGYNKYTKGIQGANMEVTSNIRLGASALNSTFRNPVAGDFRLKAGSAYVNAGSSISEYDIPTALEVDHSLFRTYTAKPRVKGNSIDIGAFEQ